MRFLILPVLMASVTATFAGESPAKAPLKWDGVDFGTHLPYAFEVAAGDVIEKGLAVRVGEKKDALLIYDTETLRVAGAWIGGKLSGAGSPAKVEGAQAFSAKHGPGFNGADSARYNGIYKNGDRVVLSYAVGKAQVLELPGSETKNGITAFTRTLSITPTELPVTLDLYAGDSDGLGEISPLNNIPVALLREKEVALAAAVIGGPATAKLEIVGGRAFLRIPKLDMPALIKIVIARVGVDAWPSFGEFLKAAPELVEPLTKGGAVTLHAPLKLDAQSGVPADDAPEAGFKPLFNGKDLSGWEGETSLWVVEDGLLKGKSPGIKQNQFLSTKENYGDFVFKAKFKLVNTSGNANSGIQFRSKRVPNSTEMSGYQADVGQDYWCCIYDESRRNKVLVHSNKTLRDLFVKRDAWNEYTITAIGEKFTLSINGVDMTQWTETESPEKAARDGQIAPQIHSGGPMEIHLKDIRIKKLK